MQAAPLLKCLSHRNVWIIPLEQNQTVNLKLCYHGSSHREELNNLTELKCWSCPQVLSNWETGNGIYIIFCFKSTHYLLKILSFLRRFEIFSFYENRPN